MLRYLCDRCETPMEDDEGASVAFNVSARGDDDMNPLSLRVIGGVLDVCPKCWPVVDGIIRERLLTTRTPAAALHGEVKPVADDRVPEPDGE